MAKRQGQAGGDDRRDICDPYRRQGLRMGARRHVIIRVLEQARDHPTAAEIHARARAIDPAISIATVYRNLKLFEELGLLRRFDFHGDGVSRYETAGRQRHQHLIDTGCGTVVEFSAPEIARLVHAIGAEMGYHIVDFRLELFGSRNP